MANFRIIEFSRIASAAGIGHAQESAQIPMYPPVATQSPISISGTSQQSAAINASTRFVLIETDGACHFAVGENPTATTNNERMAADASRYIGVTPGHKIAVIAAA